MGVIFKYNSLEKYFTTFIFFLFNIILLLWPAIYNGYPLVYSDTGTYINSGFIGEVPIDRPIVYGLFIKLTSLSYSLWLVIIAQACIVVVFIFLLVKRFITKNAFLVSTYFIFFLSLTTGLSNYTSQIMPDIFTAITIIGVVLILLKKELKLYDYLIFILVGFSAIVHLSNLLLVLLMLGASFIIATFRLIPKTNFYRILIFTLVTFFSLIFINKIYSGKYIIARASNVFVIARLIETGIVKNYLIENCNDKKYELCNRINEIPEKASDFIWTDQSPLYDSTCRSTNWTYCWEEKNQEYGTIIKGILTNFNYLKQLVWIYSKDFYSQCIDFEIGPLTPMVEGSAVYDVIKDKLNHELEIYKNAKQYKTTQEFPLLNNIQFYFLLISFVSLILLVFMRKRIILNKEHVLIIIFLFTGVLTNAFVVEVFSTVLNRYQARIIWIIPLITFILIYKLIKENCYKEVDLN